MVYAPRRPYARRPYRKNFKKSIAWKKPTGKNQKKQIYTLARRVDYLSKVQRDRTTVGRYSITTDQLTASDYTVNNLTDLTQWAAVFEEPPAITNRAKVKLMSFGIDNLFTCHQEQAPVTYTYFCVSLKPGFGAKKLVQDAGEGLGSLVPDKHYTILQGMTLLNKEFFNIHYVKRFTITATEYTSAETGGSNPQTTFKRFYHKISFPRWLNDGNSTWDDMNENAVPLGSRLYCLAFNDNSIVDLQSNKWQQTVIATVKR